MLRCEQVPLQRIADEVGTPVYIYSEQTLRRHVRVFDEAFQDVPHLICYAVKANSDINILRRFSERSDPVSLKYWSAATLTKSSADVKPTKISCGWNRTRDTYLSHNLNFEGSSRWVKLSPSHKH